MLVYLIQTSEKKVSQEVPKKTANYPHFVDNKGGGVTCIMYYVFLLSSCAKDQLPGHWRLIES